MNRVEVTALAESLAEEEAAEVVCGEQPVVLCRTADGLFAVSGICTHAYARLADGFVVDRYIECPLHQAQFDVTTGERVSGPECDNLRVFALVRDSKRLFLEVPQDTAENN